MNHSANRPAFNFYVTQLALVISSLLALSSSVIGFQADENDSPATEQMESEQQDDNETEDDGEKNKQPKVLKIGSEAPALNLDYWPTDNNGLLPPVKKFEAGKTYVLNFFQTDNPFSLGKLNSMVELQKKYADEPVQIVCICSNERDKADEFLDSEVKGDKDSDAETYIDLLNSVSTAVDSEQTATVNYVLRSNIVTAWTFIVGPTGKVEWLGLPNEVEKPLAQVVAGKWDRKAFAKEIKPKQTSRARKLKTEQLFSAWMMKKAKGKRIDPKQILKQLAEGAEDPDNEAFLIRIQSLRMVLMLSAFTAEADIEGLEEDLPKVMRSVTELSEDDSELQLNNNAWEVYEMYEAGRIEKDSELMAAAQEMAEKALKFQPNSGAVNDTVAHFVYLLDGDLERAIKLQKLAIKNSGDSDAESLEEFLKFLKKEKATGEKKSLQKQEEGDDGDEDSDF